MTVGVTLLVGKARGVDAGPLLADMPEQPASTSTMSTRHVPTHALRPAVAGTRPYIIAVFIIVRFDSFYPYYVRSLDCSLPQKSSIILHLHILVTTCISGFLLTLVYLSGYTQS